MNQESIELVIIFKQRLLDINNLIKYFEQIHHDLDGSNFQELNYSIIVKSHLKSKNLKFTKLNIQKLNTENPFNGFSLTSLLPNWKYKSTDIKFSVNYNPKFNQQNNSLTVTLNKAAFYDHTGSKKLIDLYLDLVNYIRSCKAIITYGFIFSLPNHKFPELYTAGIGNHNLTTQEEENLQLWAEKSNECNLKIWDVFWGNLVTKNHLRSIQNQNILKLWDIFSGTSTTKNDAPVIQKIIPILGESSIHIIDDNTCFFNLPGNDLILGNENKRMKNALLTIFNKLTFVS